MYDLDSEHFVRALNGEKSSSFQAILQSDDYYDRDKPFHDFSAWCAHRENVCHRLRFVTHCVVQALLSCDPSIPEKRIKNDDDHPFCSKHKDEEYQNVSSIVFLNPLLKESHLIQCKDDRKARERKRDSAFDGNQGVRWDEDKGQFQIKKAKNRDPFLSRDLILEFDQIIQAFDVKKHGYAYCPVPSFFQRFASSFHPSFRRIMGQFIIDRLELKQRRSLWILLGMLLKRMPYGVALQILNRNREQLLSAEMAKDFVL